MYSTLDGAKQRAKQIRRLFDNCHIEIPLAKCQRAIAHAGGFKDWSELEKGIASRGAMPGSYDFWGKMMEGLPAPCHYPVMAHVSDIYAKPKVFAVEDDKWIRYVLPFAMALEGYHRKQTPSLRPGSGKGQRLRQAIVSGLLLNCDDIDTYCLWLCPDPLAIKIAGTTAQILPKLANRRGFDEAVTSLVSEGVLEVRQNSTRVLAPPDDKILKTILQKAKAWKSLTEVDFAFFPHDRKVSAALQRQYDLDRQDAGPKTDFAYLDYRGVRLTSRFDVAGEYAELKDIVDAMDESIRGEVVSIWCDSLAGSCYTVELQPEAYGAGLCYLIREVFRAACNGFNGIYVNQGEDSWSFDPEWPGYDFL